jgi:hypothetical protein
MGEDKPAKNPATRRKSVAPKTARGGDEKGKGDKAKGNKTRRASVKPQKGAKEEKAATSASSASAEAVDAAAEAAAVEEASTANQKRRPKAEALKTVTTGHVAAVDFVEEHADGIAAAEVPAAAAVPAADGELTKMTWSCLAWLASFGDLSEKCIAPTLLFDSEGTVLEDGAALAHVRALDSRDELLERLRVGGALEKLADAIWPKLEVLKAGPATAAELANAWKEEGAGDLLYGGLPAFFQGLEPRIGSPDPKVYKDMVADHCARADAVVEFTTGNYNVVTTSEVGSDHGTTRETARVRRRATACARLRATARGRRRAGEGARACDPWRGLTRGAMGRARGRWSGSSSSSPRLRLSGPLRSGS